MINKKIYIVISCLLALIVAGLPTSVSLAETKKLPNPIKKINIYNLNLKKLQMSEKKMRPLLKEAFDKISEECCENNFEEKERLLEIKSNLEKCLNSSDKKCFRGPLFYSPLKKPLKLLLLESVDESKVLLLKNSRKRYDNQLIKESDEAAKAKEKIANDHNKLKEAYNILVKNNENLKKRIEVMLKNYETRIAELEEDIVKIQKEYSKVYKMLPKHKQKQLEKESSSE